MDTRLKKRQKNKVLLQIAKKIISASRNFFVRYMVYDIKIQLAVILLGVLYFVSRESDLLFHTSAELFALIIAASAFVIIWNSKDIVDNNYYMLIGASFFFVAIFGILHTMAFLGISGYNFFRNETPNNLTEQLWLIQRLILASSFALAPLFINSKKVNFARFFWNFFVIAVLLLYCIFVWKLIPVAVTSGNRFTFFNICAEFLIISLFLIALWGTVKKRNYFDSFSFKMIILYIILAIFVDIFMSFNSKVLGLFNFFGHFLEIISFYIIYNVIIVSVITKPARLLFHNLEKSHRELQKSQNRLLLTSGLLKEKSEESQGILDNLEDGVVFMDRDGKIIYINEAYRRMFDLEKDILGKDAIKLVPMYEKSGRKSVDSKREKIRQSLIKSGSNKAYRDIFTFKKSKSDIKMLSFVSSPVVKNDKIIGISTIYRDITEENKIENMKNDFISFAAHELRTPLSTIRLASDSMEMKNAGGACNRCSQYLIDIRKESEHMAAIIDTFLDASRIESGTFPIRPAMHNLSTLIDEAVESQLAGMVNKKLVLKREYQQFSLNLLIDKDVFILILENIISNAVKYSFNGGIIKIEAGKSDKDVVVRVSDNGPGIPKNKQGIVFEKMGRADTVHGGYGIGLYLVKLLVARYGGKIWFESPIRAKSKWLGGNKGTSFSFTIAKKGMSEVN